MRFISYRFLALTALLMNASAVLSQDPGTGTPPFRSFQFGQFDQVNLSNLNATSSIPIVSIPGRGLDFSFSLYYNGLVWKMGSNGAPGGTGNGTGVQWLPNNIIDNVAVDFFGWNVYRVIPQILHTKTVRPCGVGHVTQYGNYVVIEQNGTVHSFGIRFNVPGCGGYNAPRTGYATDGSGYFVDATSPDAPIAYTPSGVKITTTGVMTDSNGNQIKSVAINSNETDWIDTLGRTALKIITTYAGNFPSQVQYQTQDSSGSWQTTTLNFLTLKVQTNFGCSQVQENGSSQGLPVSLSLPNGRQYTFAYELTPGSTSTYTGRLQRVTLPAGGSYEYDYPGANDSMDCTYGTTTNLSQVVSGGGATLTTSFLRTQTGTYTAQTTVTPTASPSDPSISNQVLYSFDHNHQIQKFIYKGVYPTATLLRTVNTTWSSVLPNGFPTTKITILEDGQTQSEVDTTYDSTNFGNGNLLSENDYGFGTGVRGPLLRSKTFSYLGGTTYTSRNIQDRVTSVVISDGTGAVVARTDTTYDGSSLNPCPTGIPQHDDANYDCLFLARGNPTSVTRYLDPATPGNAIVRNMSYDIFGNVRQADMDCCTSRASNYSASTQYGYPDSQVDGPQGGLQLTRSFTYYFPVGLVASRTDPNGSTISFTYDLMNRLTNAAYPDGGNSSYSYNDSSRIRTETITIGNGVSPKSTQLYYDQLGQPVQTQLTSDPQGTDITDVTYDALGRKKTVSNPHRGFISATDGITTYVYDAFGRASQIIPPDGSSTSNNLSMTFALNCEIISDQTLRKRKLCTDPLDRLIQVFEPDASGNLVIETDYQYDALDNLTSVIQNGSRQRTFQYDALNRLTKATNPETGTIQYFYTKSDGSTCGPNPLSVCRKLDARGITSAYAYDGLNRISSKSYTDSTPAVAYFYDQNNCLGQPTCYNLGHRTGMSDGAGSESWSYDSMGRILSDSRTTNVVTKSTTYAYNLDGSIKTLTYPSGRSITYTYNSAARVLSAADQTNSLNYATAATYAPHGNLASLQNGGSLYSTYLFNNRLQPCWFYTTTSSTGAPASCTQTGVAIAPILDYQYDFGLGTANNGNVNAINNRRDPTRSQNFTYDSLNRLATAQTQTAGVTIPNTNCWGLTFGYDPWGDLLQSAITGPSGCSEPWPANFTVDTSNRILTNTVAGQVTNFCYDAAGNLIDTVPAPATCAASGPYQYAYNAENQLIAAGGVTYTYDGDGRRVRKSNGKIYWYGMGSDALDETDLAGNTNNTSFFEYVFFGGKRIARRDYQNNVVYYFADHLGTSRIITNSAGNILDDSDFYPFGGERVVTNTDPNNYKFTGKERDSESGLDNFGARYYSSSIGSFMSPDWSVTPEPVPYAKLDNPQSLNLYSYVQNSPVTNFDADGHWCLFGRIGTTCKEPPPPPRPTPPAPPAVITPGTPQNNLANAQDAARTNPSFAPKRPPDNRTFCNLATMCIVQVTNAPTEGLTYPNGNTAAANDASRYLPNSSKWHEVTPEQAQDLANQGVTVVAVQRNPGGHGHMATVRPELMPGAGQSLGQSPLINNIGAKRDIGTADQSFRHDQTVHYYAPNQP